MGNQREMNMRNPMGQLLLWVAELLDRSMIAVPDVDLPIPSTSGHPVVLARGRLIGLRVIESDAAGPSPPGINVNVRDAAEAVTAARPVEACGRLWRTVSGGTCRSVGRLAVSGDRIVAAVIRWWPSSTGLEPSPSRCGVIYRYRCARSACTAAATPVTHRPWASRSLAGSRYASWTSAGTTFAESCAIVAKRMRSLLALQCSDRNLQPHPMYKHAKSMFSNNSDVKSVVPE